VETSPVELTTGLPHWRTWLRQAGPRLVVGAVLGGAALWLAFRDVEAEAVWAALGQVNYGWVALAQLSVLVTLALQTVRWRLLFYPDHARRGWLALAGAVVVGQMVNILLPARLGEVARVYLAGTSERVAKTRVATTLVVEKVSDLAVFGLAGVLLLVTMSLPDWLRGSSDTLVVTGVAAVAATFGLTAWGRPLLRWLEARAPRLPAPLGERVWRLGHLALDGLSALRRPEANLALWGLAVLVLLSSTLTNYLLFRAFGLRLSFGAALFVLVVLQVGIAPPSLPGKLGVFHYLAVLALSFFAVERGVALGYAFALYAVALLSKVVLGAAWLAWRRWAPTRAAPAERPALDRAGG
jgi:uncharacterized membrane protein YbhN (UPF0104 family)